MIFTAPPRKISLCLFLMLLLGACRKHNLELDTPSQNEELQAIVQKFTQDASSVSPVVGRIAQQLQALPNADTLISQIALHVGYPLWKKYMQHSPKASGIVRHSSPEDTLYYIPLVQDSMQQVDAFLLAQVSDSIRLSLYRSNHYEPLGFGDPNDKKNNAERLMLQFMVLNYHVFGYQEFKINDPRLFRANKKKFDHLYQDSSRILKISFSAGSGISQLSAGYWEEGTVTHCEAERVPCSFIYGTASLNPTQQSFPSCTDYYYTGNFLCETTTSYYWVPGDDDYGGGGGYTGGDGSGGGGGGTYTNADGSPVACNPTPELDNGLPPCPDNARPGVEPILEIMPDESGSYTIETNDNQPGGYDETAFPDFDFQQNSWPEIAPVIDVDDFVGIKASTDNCFDLARQQLAKKGYQISNYLDPGQTYQIYTEQAGPNNDWMTVIKGISYLVHALGRGIPVLVGVDNRPGDPGNPDHSTDHYIVIVGMGTDTKGRYFRFFDNASNIPAAGANPENKLYFDQNNWILEGTSQTTYGRNPNLHNYIVTMIRRSKPI